MSVTTGETPTTQQKIPSFCLETTELALTAPGPLGFRAFSPPEKEQPSDNWCHTMTQHAILNPSPSIKMRTKITWSFPEIMPIVRPRQQLPFPTERQSAASAAINDAVAKRGPQYCLAILWRRRATDTVARQGLGQARGATTIIREKAHQ